MDRLYPEGKGNFQIKHKVKEEAKVNAYMCICIFVSENKKGTVCTYK